MIRILTSHDGYHDCGNTTNLGEGADTIRREEFVFIQEVFQHTEQFVLGGDGQQVEETSCVHCVNRGDLGGGLRNQFQKNG